MIAPELAERTVGAPGGVAGVPARVRVSAFAPGLIGLTAVGIAGVVLRVLAARQSLFADELSTYWIVATHGFGSMWSLLYGTASIHHAEITPPLSFVASWVTTQLGHTSLLLRLPSLLAGIATIPLVYFLGLRTVGRRASWLATALTALSPFMIYYSAEARAYGLMMFLVVASTLSLLRAIDTGRTRWWILYALSSCLALYTHYTCGFVLAVQLGWVLWAHPEARKPALLFNLGAAAGLLPWIPGLINDWTSPTLTILSALSPFGAGTIPRTLGHWAIGYPYAGAGSGLTRLPGVVPLTLLALAGLLVLGSLGMGIVRDRADRWLRAVDRRVVLVFALALATPVGEALVSAAGTHIFGVRNLAASWPALALSCAALAYVGGRLPGLAAGGLAIAAFALGARTMLTAPYARPDYQAAASFIDDHSRLTDVVIDGTGGLSPGPLTPLDVTLRRSVRLFRAGAPAERAHPFGFSDPIVPLGQAVRQAVAAAHGAPVVVVTSLAPSNAQLAARVELANPGFPPPYRLVETRIWNGIVGTELRVYAERA